MATDLSFVEYVIEQSQLGARLTYKKLFGEYALYLNGKVIALLCDNSLFIKPSEPTAGLTEHLPQGFPYPGARLYPVGDQLLDEPERLQELLVATEKHLPVPKPKKARKRTER